MIETASIDMTGLHRLTDGLRWALIGAGRDGDAANIVADESSKLAMECADRVAKKDLAKEERKMKSDVRRAFLAGPEEAFPVAKRGGHNGITWLYAGENFLAGTATEDLRPDLTAAEMLKLKKTLPSRPGLAWPKIGVHGKQSVVKMNRIVVRRSEREKLYELIRSRFGRMKATFARSGFEIAKSIGKTVRVPAWISRHFEDMRLPAGYEIGSNPERPFVEFSSRAPGIEKQHKKIAAAVKVREAKMRKHLDRILTGYANDTKNGGAPRRHATDVDADYELFFGAE